MKLLGIFFSSMFLIGYGNDAFATYITNSNWISGAKIAQGDTLTNSGYIFDYVWNDGTLVNQTGGNLILAYPPSITRGTLINSGNISIGNDIFQNDGILINNGNITQIRSDTWLSNSASGTFTNQSIISAQTFYNYGTLINQGTISGGFFYQGGGVLTLGGSMNQNVARIDSGAVTFNISGNATGQFGFMNADVLSFGTSTSNLWGNFSGLTDNSINFDFTGTSISEIAGHSFNFLSGGSIQGFKDSMLDTSAFTTAVLSFNIQKTFGAGNQLTGVTLEFNNLTSLTVPEPDAWVMMLLGFSLMVFLVRHKKFVI
jgi:hypothetical protein